MFLGTPPLRTNTEAFNGTSWTELNDLSTAREGAAPGSNFGTMNSFAAGGYNAGENAVEDWTADARYLHKFHRLDLYIERYIKNLEMNKGEECQKNCVIKS